MNFALLAILSGAGAYALVQWHVARPYRLTVLPVWLLGAPACAPRCADPLAVYHVFSYQKQTCGIAGKGLWDPDGCGLRPVPASIRDKLKARFHSAIFTTAVVAFITWLPYFFY